ncbi:MAG: leucine-rich repeat protein [Bacteroidaceae bacterium]|nr:leucine-rich repeat protein [Bacteroidaceae bacterium]
MKKINLFFMLCLFCLISIGASAIPNNTIYYTSSDGNVVYPNYSNAFGSATIVSNEYSNGQGIITFDRNLTSIGDIAFCICDHLTSVTIPNSVTEIGKYAFEQCSGLTSVTIGNSVTSIGYYAFEGCKGLTSVEIPNSVTSIGERAFSGCSGLTSLTIGNSVTSIGEGAFYECSGLTSVTISNSVDSIGNYAFYNCLGLTSLTIPNSVTSIGDYAFGWCRGLTSVTIGNSVTEIGSSAFEGCFCLTSVTIGNSVTSIGSSAFRYCSGLTSVTIPNSVTSIGSYAFEGPSRLTSVYVGWNNADRIPVLTSWDFPYSTCDLYVPTGTKAIYQEKDYWNSFKNIYENEFESVLLGDANDDGSVDVSDITSIATYILNGKATPWNEKNADVNGDGVIDVSDITGVASIILGKKSLCPDDHHPHAIDMGLPSGTKWCCCNVGATTPEGYGGYYAWGETSEKSVYDLQTYAYWRDQNENGFVDDGDWANIGTDIAGTQYDVAHVSMGGSWRMPSHVQQMELVNNCIGTWTTQDGVNGISVIGKNGGQIFLPAAGYRQNEWLGDVGVYSLYWSSSLDPRYYSIPHVLYFYSGFWGWDYFERLVGLSVRAVCP